MIVDHCWSKYLTDYGDRLTCRRVPLYEVTRVVIDTGVGGTLPMCQACLNRMQAMPDAYRILNIDDILFDTGVAVRAGETVMSIVEGRRKTDG